MFRRARHRIRRRALYLERLEKEQRAPGGTASTTKACTLLGSTTASSRRYGLLGADQLSWLKADLASLSASTPIVIFAHIPLWMFYPEWVGDAGRSGGTRLPEAFCSVHQRAEWHIHQVGRS